MTVVFEEESQLNLKTKIMSEALDTLSFRGREQPGHASRDELIQNMTLYYDTVHFTTSSNLQKPHHFLFPAISP